MMQWKSFLRKSSFNKENLVKSSRELELYLFNLLIYSSHGNEDEIRKTSKVEGALGRTRWWPPLALSETTSGVALQMRVADQTDVWVSLDLPLVSSTSSSGLPSSPCHKLKFLFPFSLISNGKHRGNIHPLSGPLFHVTQEHVIGTSSPTSPHCSSKFETWMGHIKWNRVWRFIVITCWHFPTSLTYHMI